MNHTGLNAVSLEHIRQSDINIAGGKAANLGELIHGGFPVPPGFVITTKVYASALSKCLIDKNLLQASKRPARIMREAIIQCRIDEYLARDIQTQLDYLARSGSSKVYAVRSSATAEDLEGASFAGQYETFYYVTAETLDSKIIQCWASLWSDQAYAYRESLGIDHFSVNMAVVVQEMIAADISGITFTANPVNGDKDEIITESSWGMGAALVDGRVSPDRYIVDKKNRKLKSRQIADKKLMVPAHVNTLVTVDADQVKLPSLDDDQLRQVIQCALKLQTYFGTEQDLEWAIAGETFHLLQSRAITASGQDADRIPEGRFVIFKSMVENASAPFLPLSEDLLSRSFPFLTFIQGRIYLNVSHYKWLVPLKISDREFAQLASLNWPKNFRTKISWPKILLLSLFAYINYLVTGIFARRTEALPADFMENFRRKVTSIEHDDSLDALQSFQRLFLEPGFFEPIGNMPLGVNLISPRYAVLLWMINRLLSWWLPGLDADAASILTAGGDGILSTEMGREIQRLAIFAKQSQAVSHIIRQENSLSRLSALQAIPEAEAFLKQFNNFLTLHGHRCLKEFELNSKRWQEDPEPVFAMIRNFLNSEVDPVENESKVAENRAAFTAKVQAKLLDLAWESRFGLRSKLLNRLIDEAKYLIRLRENSRFYHIMAFYLLRKKILKLAKILLSKGCLGRLDDIYYLDWTEIKALELGKLNWHDVELRVRRRRLRHIRLSRFPPKQTFGIDSDINPSERGSGEPVVLEGYGASPGIVTGYARVILDPSIDAKVLPGEILIAPYTDPAWTPLFLTAAAAVVEIGSYLSHAGTIAREYGMPCVVDVDQCTSKIRTGDRLLVDGVSGRVVKLDELTGELQDD